MDGAIAPALDDRHVKHVSSIRPLGVAGIERAHTNEPNGRDGYPMETSFRERTDTMF